jgi:hypothetical protein
VTRLRRSPFVALLLLAAAASPACGRLEATPPLAASMRAGSVRPAELRDEAAALLVLAPDRRVLAALADLEPILSRAPRTTVEARRLPSGRFALVRGQDALGELVAFATLDDALSVLVARASVLLREHPLTPLAPVAAGDAGDASAAVPMADPLAALAVAEQRLRAESSAASLREAAHAAVALARGVPAEARASDLIFARALALLAIESIVAPAAAAVERPRLAEAMGYPEDAERARAALAAERARRGERLADRAEHAEPIALVPASLAARLRVRRGDEVDDESAIARATLATTVLAAARANGDERAAKAQVDVDALAPRAAASVPKVVYGWLGTQPAQAIARFPADLAKAFASELGPVLDAELHRAALRCFFFDAVAHLARRGGVPELAAAALPQSRAGERLLALRAGTARVSVALAADEAREIGDVGAIEPFAVAAATRGLDDAERAQLPALLRAIDGRPANRAALASLVRDALGDDETANRWSGGARVDLAAELEARVDAAWGGLRGADRAGGAKGLASPAIVAGAWSRVVAPRLVRALHGAPDADVDAVVGALRGARVGLAPLRALAVALARDARDGPAGRLATADVADVAQSGEGGEGGDDARDALDRLALQVVARRAGMLPDAALPPHLRDLAAQVAFGLGDDELLRALGPASRAGDVAELRLLLRAAAAVRVHDRDRQASLRAELVAPPARGFYGRLAAFVLDGADAAGLAASPLDPAAACEALCFIALRAESEGRVDDARPWRRALGLCPAMRLGER